MKQAIVHSIAALARVLVGGELWAAIVTAVNAIESEPIPGTEKKAFILVTLKALAPEVASWLLSMVIDIAVGKMKVSK